MPFQKGQSGNPAGKKKGTQNKATVALKEMILQALDNAGGVRYLRAQAKDNPAAFLTLVGKVLPMQVSGDPSSPLRVVVNHRFTSDDSNE